MSEMPPLNTSLRTARTLLGDGSLDCSAALAFLNTIPDPHLAETAEAIRHAREAVARYMLARVLIALEEDRAGGPAGRSPASP